MAEKRLLNIDDWNTIAAADTAMNTRIAACETAVAGMPSLASRMTTAEGTITSHTSSLSALGSRMTTAEGNITSQASSINSLGTRMSSAEGTIASHTSSIGSLGTRMTAAESTISATSTDVASLKTWRANKAAAKADVSTSFSVATDVITLGLAAPRASSINTVINQIMTEVNSIYAILRSREMMAV